MGAEASGSSIMDDLRAVSATLKEESEGVPEVSDAAPETSEAPEPGAGEAPEIKPDKTGRLHAKDGKFAPKAKDEPEEAPRPKQAVAPKPSAAALPPKSAEATPSAAAPALKAPSSWKPEVRERFRELPPEVQQEILRREREASTGLGQAAEHRKAAERWQQTVAPYEMLARADGQDVYQKVDGLLRLEASMRTSPEPMKARMVANIIRQYGISVDSLAEALNGASAEGPARHVAPAPDAYRDPRVDQLFGYLQQQAQRQQQQVEEEARRELEAFQSSDHPAAEFFDDLKKAAGRLIALAKEDGETLSLQDAFELAASRNPSISKILAQRKAAEDAKARAADLQKKRAATVGVRGTPPPVEGDDESDGSLRSDLEMVARTLNRRA